MVTGQPSYSLEALQADSTAIVSNKCQRKLSKRWSLIFYSLPTSNKHQWTITSIQFICSSFAVVWLPKWLPHVNVMHQAVPHPEDRRRLLQISKQVGAGPLKVDPFECPSKDFREFGWIWTDYRLYYHRYIYIHTQIVVFNLVIRHHKSSTLDSCFFVPTLETQVDRQLSFMAQKTMIKALRILIAAVRSCQISVVFLQFILKLRSC